MRTEASEPQYTHVKMVLKVFSFFEVFFGFRKFSSFQSFFGKIVFKLRVLNVEVLQVQYARSKCFLEPNVETSSHILNDKPDLPH